MKGKIRISMGLTSADRLKSTQSKSIFFIAILLLLINISGDHVFNKVNHLKLLLVVFCTLLLSIFVLLKVKYFRLKLLVFLSLPILATFPGLMLNEGRFSYNLPIELSTQIFCTLWAFLVFSLMQASPDNQTRNFIYIFLPVAYFVCFIGFIEKLGFSPLTNIPLNPFEASTLKEPWQYQGITWRIRSTFGNVNYFASFLIQLLPVILALVVVHFVKLKTPQSNFQRRPILVLGAALSVLLALIFTETRAAIVAALISLSLFIYVMLHLKLVSKKWTFSLVVIAITVVSVYIYLKLGMELGRFSSLIKLETWWPRLVPWKTAWESTLSAPLFGHGIGSSYQLFFEYIAADSRLFSGSRSYNHVHNELLQILQEGGLLGLAVYLFFWAAPIFLAIRIVLDPNKATEVKILLTGLVAGILAYHIHGLFSVAPRMITSRLIAYTLLAILLVILQQELRQKESSVKNKNNRLVFIAVILPIMVCTIVLLLPVLQSQYQYTNALVKPARDDLYYELAKNTEDIYLLEAAAKEAFKQKNAERLLEIMDRAGGVFPHYRELDAYHAYALYWSGEVDEARRSAVQYQSRDSYSQVASSLLLKIALEKSEEGAFKEQIKKALEFNVCREGLQPCDKLELNVLIGQFALPFQIQDRTHKINVFIDTSFLSSLKVIQHSLQTSQLESGEAFNRIISLLSQGLFFKPNSLARFELAPLDYQALSQYLVFVNNNTASEAAALSYTKDLEKKMDLKEFIQRRELLISMSDQLMRAIN